MPTFICERRGCGKEFYSKHSTARFCGKKCSGIASMSSNETRARHSAAMRKYEDDDLIGMLVSQSEKLGRTPTYRECIPSSSTFENRFGSYTNAVILAGLIPNPNLPALYLKNGRSSIRLSLRFRVLQRDSFRCQYCGGTPSEGYILHVDHKIPSSKGGVTSEDNLATSCLLCNLGKSNHDLNMPQ